MKVFKYFYSNRGPVIDYENQELVHFFFNELSKYVKNIVVYTYISIHIYHINT